MIPNSKRVLGPVLMAAKANRQTGTWDASVNTLVREELRSRSIEEGTWEPHLHPRSRLGQFRDATNLVEPKPSRAHAPNTPKVHEPKVPQITYDKEIADNVHDAKSAETYLTGLGLVAKLSDENLGPTENNPAFFKDISQAVKDAITNHPVLLEPKTKGSLKAVRMASRDKALLKKYDAEEWDETTGSASGLWGTTGSDPDARAAQGPPTDDRPALDPDPTMPTAIELWNVWPADRGEYNTPGYDFNSREATPGLQGYLSWADSIPYGTMMHELGHATARAAGLDGATLPQGRMDQQMRWYNPYPTPGYLTLMDKFDLNPAEIARFSKYAAADPSEAWAEIFTTMNTPGALEHLPADLRTKLIALREETNKTYGTAVL